MSLKLTRAMDELSKERLRKSEIEMNLEPLLRLFLSLHCVDVEFNGNYEEVFQQIIEDKM